MLTNLPDSVVIIFLLTVILTFLLFINAVKIKATAAVILVVWLAVTGVLAFKGVFQDTSTIPPRLMMGIAPAILSIILLLVTKSGRKFTASLNVNKFTLVNTAL